MHPFGTRPRPRPPRPPKRRGAGPAPGRALAAGLAATGLVAGLAWAPAAAVVPPSAADAAGVLDLGAADVVLQRRPEGCALAVLTMLAGRLGTTTDEDALARLAGDRLGPDGLTLAEVAALAAEIGLAGAWLRADPADPGSLPAPFAAELAPTAGAPAGHLVVVRRVAAAGILVADPARGLTVWPAEAFASAWTGRAFVPEAS